MKICLECNCYFDKNGWLCPACQHHPSVLADRLAFAPDLADENDGFDAEAFHQLAPVEARNFWFRSRNQLIVWALQSYFPYAKNFLEIGCGTGFVLSGIAKKIPSLRLSGSEIFTAGLEFSKQRLATANLFQMDARRIPFYHEFDCIGAFDVLEHIKEDEAVLSEMYRAIVPGGGLLLTVPQHPWLWSQTDECAHHVRRYCSKGLREKVEQAGFQVMRVTSFVSLLLPPMLLSRIRQRKPNSKHDGLAELNMSGWLNQLLTQVMTWERYLIQAGLSFPLGGSLLLIATKSA